jgi:hypothetical protein
MTDLRQSSAVPNFRTPRPECRWQTASDGGLVMVWAIADAAAPALRVVGGNPNAGRPAPAHDLAKAAPPIKRARRYGERLAIALLLGVGGYLTLISFVSDYATFP